MAGSLGGLCAMTKLLEHGCRLVGKYRTRMSAVIAAAVVSGTITSSQASQVNAWLDALQGVCAIFKLVTGY